MRMSTCGLDAIWLRGRDIRDMMEARGVLRSRLTIYHLWYKEIYYSVNDQPTSGRKPELIVASHDIYLKDVAKAKIRGKDTNFPPVNLARSILFQSLSRAWAMNTLVKPSRSCKQVGVCHQLSLTSWDPFVLPTRSPYGPSIRGTSWDALFRRVMVVRVKKPAIANIRVGYMRIGSDVWYEESMRYYDSNFVLYTSYIGSKSSWYREKSQNGYAQGYRSIAILLDTSSVPVSSSPYT